MLEKLRLPVTEQRSHFIWFTFFICGTIWANGSSMPHAKQHNRIKTEQRCLCLWGWPLRPIKLFTDADSHALWLCDPCSATPTISFYNYNTLQSPSTAVENSLWPRAMINWCGARPPSQENCSTLWTFRWQLMGNAKDSMEGEWRCKLGHCRRLERHVISARLSKLEEIL